MEGINPRSSSSLIACTAFLVVGLCTATALKRRARRRKQLGEPEVDETTEPAGTRWSESRPGWCSIKKVLMSSVRGSGASKWDESTSGSSRRERPTTLLVGGGCEAGDLGWQSHNSVSPVWQRPILMGGKCELPRFSGAYSLRRERQATSSI